MQLAHSPPGLDVHDPHCEVVTYDGKKTAFTLEGNRDDGRREHNLLQQLSRVEVEEL